MALLPMQMVMSLIQACTKAGIDSQSLLATLPPELAARVKTADTPATQLLNVWCHLNNLTWPEELAHPLRDVLEAGRYLARPFGLSPLFEEALVQTEEPATLLDSSKRRAFHALFTRRTKEKYVDIGCRVTPSIHDPPGPFVVEHPDRRTSVVAVYYWESDAGLHLEAAISGVHQWLQILRDGGEDAEGYVVLAPSARKVDREKVLQAQLHPIDYCERKSVDLDTVKRVVQCLFGAAPRAPETHFWIVQGGEALAVQEALAAFRNDLHTRVWLLLQPREAEMDTFVEHLVHVAARSFLQHGPPGPLPLGVDWRARRVAECACDAFIRYGIPVAPIALAPVLREGLLCPILVHGSSERSPSALDPSLIPRLLEGISAQSKAVVVFPPEDWEAARRADASLRGAGCPARLVRTLASIG